MNSTATVFWSIVILAIVAWAGWIHFRHQRSIEETRGYITWLDRTANGAINSMANHLVITTHEWDATKRAVRILVTNAERGDPDSILALPGLVMLLERTTDALERENALEREDARPRPVSNFPVSDARRRKGPGEGA